ncbi:MAG: hypothetical protein OCD76_22470 [Reichenbachiella sp.]
MSISYIELEGQKIMYADYSGCPETDQQIDLLDKVAVEITAFNPPIPLLVSYDGVSGGVKYMTKLKEYGNTVFKKHMKCSAVLGITGLKKILFNGYSRATGAKNIAAFSSREEALEWIKNYQE